MKTRVYKINIKKFALFLMLVTILQILLALINPYKYFPMSWRTIFYYIQYFVFGLISLALINRRLRIESYIVNKPMVMPNKINYLALLYAFPAYLAFIAAILFSIKNGIDIQELRDIFFYGDGSVLPFMFGEIFVYIAAFIGLGYYFFISYAVRFKLYGQKSDQGAIVAVASGLFILDSATGGRMAVFYMFLILLVIKLLFHGSHAKFYSGKMVKISLITFAGIFFVILISRLESNKSFIEFLYQYMVGPLFLMEQGLSDIFGLMHNPDIRFGMSAMSIDWIVVGFVKFLGFDFRTLFDVANNNLATGYYLNDSYGINAFFTAPFYFALDFGDFLGVSVFLNLSVLLFIARLSRNEMCFATVVVFVGFSLILGIRENIFNSPSFLLTLVLLYLVPLKPIVKS